MGKPPAGEPDFIFRGGAVFRADGDSAKAKDIFRFPKEKSQF